MLKPRILLLIFFLLLSFTWLFSSGLWKRTKAGSAEDNPKSYLLTNPSLEKAKLKAASAKMFVKQKGYNERICFLVDMSLPSGHNRFFVFNLKKDTLQNSGLVTHGRCNQYWLEGRKYGNTVGCPVLDRKSVV